MDPKVFTRPEARTAAPGSACRRAARPATAIPGHLRRRDARRADDARRSNSSVDEFYARRMRCQGPSSTSAGQEPASSSSSPLPRRARCRAATGLPVTFLGQARPQRAAGTPASSIPSTSSAPGRPERGLQRHVTHELAADREIGSAHGDRTTLRRGHDRTGARSIPWKCDWQSHAGRRHRNAGRRAGPAHRHRDVCRRSAQRPESRGP